jgi:hypothetical protein
MNLEDKSEVLFQYGPIIWFSLLVGLNLLGFLLSKWQKWDFIEEFSKFSLKEVFGCDLCFIETDKDSENITENIKEDNSESGELIIRKQLHYVNKDCNNIQINIHKLKNAYFIHSNCTVLFLGYLFLKIVLTIQILSTVCLEGYKCMNSSLKDVCKNMNYTQNSTNMVPFLCEKYGVESFDTLVVNIGVFSGLLKFIFEINKYVFKYSVKLTLKLSKLLSKRIQQKYLMIIPFLIITIVIFLIVQSLVKVPGKNFVYNDEYYNAKLISCAAILLNTIYAGCSTANHLFLSNEIKNQLYLVYHREILSKTEKYGSRIQSVD